MSLMNSPAPVTVNRTMVGIIGLVLLVAAGLLWGLGLEGSNPMWSGACLKVGIVMATLWLALPSLTRNEELGRASLGMIAGTIVVALLVARTKISLQVLIPAAVTMGFLIRFLRPSSPKRPNR
jgi:hypothetical protein